MVLREAPGFLWRTLVRFFENDLPQRAAALSFYTFLSLPALLAILLLVIGAVADEAAARRAILNQVGGLIGGAGAEQVATILEHARRTEVSPTVTALLGILFVLFGATTAFAQLQGALNTAWGVKPDPARPILKVFLGKRLVSFGVVLGVAFMLLVSLALSAALTAVGEHVTGERTGGLSTTALLWATYLFSFAVIAGLFAAMYRFLPDAVIAWRDVAIGSIVTAALFVAGKAAIGAYIGSVDPASAYGAAGSLAVVLLWVYYTSMVIFFGAEFTAQWAESYGRGVRPEPGAVEVDQREVVVKRGPPPEVEDE
jgi:membrane protein